MLFDARIGNKDLAQLCRRLATSLEAGIDARRVWERESQGRSSGALRSRLAVVSDHVNRGRSVTDGLDQTGEYFPPLFRSMARVGEQTGQLAEVFRQLADHYDHQVSLRRTFLSAIAWPMIELGASIVVIGLLIWILGLIKPAGGQPIDVLGFGLVGNSGLAIYLLIVGSIAFAIFLVIRATQRGLTWVKPLQRLVLQLPWIGGTLQTLALSRLAWSLHLTLETGMGLREALKLSLASTMSARYTDHIEMIGSQVMRGREIHEVLAETGVYPRDFLDTLEVGERSGRLPESMAILSRQYQEAAQRAMATLTLLAGFAVWGLVALAIIVLIFKLFFFFYLGTIQSMSQP
jgi:type II secretory pathway component PulF